MPRELLKQLDQMDDAEKEALAAALYTNDWHTDVFDVHHAAGKAVRQQVEEGVEHFTRDDVVAVLNMDEVARRLAHLLFSIVANNMERVRSNLTSAKCSYCDWTWRDESWDWPTDREVNDEDLAAIDARVKGEVLRHVAVCPKHPMRALEAQVDDLTQRLRELHQNRP